MWFTWLVDGRVAASSLPYPDEVPDLAAAGIRAILSLTTRNPFPDGLPAELRHLHVPVPDMTTPTREALVAAVGFVRECEREGRPVLVHCAAGLGRTGTVLACWLVAGGMEPGKAIDTVRRVRPGSVETLEQESAVHGFRWEVDGDE